jgi:hypothetical protein
MAYEIYDGRPGTKAVAILHDYIFGHTIDPQDLKLAALEALYWANGLNIVREEAEQDLESKAESAHNGHLPRQHLHEAEAKSS